MKTDTRAAVPHGQPVLSDPHTRAAVPHGQPVLSDLHTHSTASDGQYTPSELVELAGRRGLGVLALTDHDSTDGLDEAIQSGERLGVRVIRGVELSAKEYSLFHILGYSFAPDAPALANICQWMKQERDERGPRIARFLSEKGVPVDMEEVLSLVQPGGRLGRPHFARALVSRGYVSDTREAFDRFLDTAEYHARVKQVKPSVRQCLDAIHDGGGKASLAHPYQIGLSDGELDALVGKLTAWGLDAIECCYPRFTPEQQAFYLSLAEKYRLHVTGGSDFHGERVKPDIQLAALDLDLDWLE